MRILTCCKLNMINTSPGTHFFHNSYSTFSELAETLILRLVLNTMDLTDMWNSLQLSAVGRRSEQSEGGNICKRRHLSWLPGKVDSLAHVT